MRAKVAFLTCAFDGLGGQARIVGGRRQAPAPALRAVPRAPPRTRSISAWAAACVVRTLSCAAAWEVRCFFLRLGPRGAHFFLRLAPAPCASRSSASGLHRAQFFLRLGLRGAQLLLRRRLRDAQFFRRRRLRRADFFACRFDAVEQPRVHRLRRRQPRLPVGACRRQCDFGGLLRFLTSLDRRSHGFVRGHGREVLDEVVRQRVEQDLRLAACVSVEFHGGHVTGISGSRASSAPSRIR